MVFLALSLWAPAAESELAQILSARSPLSAFIFHPCLSRARARPLTRCFCAGGVENPCDYTVDGFKRSRTPCGLNGTCSLLTTKSTMPGKTHQFDYNCVCDENFVGEFCSRCSQGHTWRTGCRGASAISPRAQPLLDF